jgi:hypothetical protein
MGGVAVESLREILRFPTALPVAEGVAARHCSSLFFKARRTAGLPVGEKATHLKLHRYGSPDTHTGSQSEQAQPVTITVATEMFVAIGVQYIVKWAQK